MTEPGAGSSPSEPPPDTSGMATGDEFITEYSRKALVNKRMDHNRPDLWDRPAVDRPAAPRISVTVSPDSLAAIDLIIERERVTLTEAVRRLITYGDLVYRAIKEDEATVLVRKGDETREVII